VDKLIRRTGPSQNPPVMRVGFVKGKVGFYGCANA
jgi:hypothetical protein